MFVLKTGIAIWSNPGGNRCASSSTGGRRRARARRPCRPPCAPPRSSAAVRRGRARRPRPGRFARRGCRRSRSARDVDAARLERVERAGRAQRVERGRRGPGRTATHDRLPHGTAMPSGSSRSETNCGEHERLASAARGEEAPVSARPWRSSSSTRLGIGRAELARQPAVSSSFSSRKLRPSSASTMPLTTPPKRVAIPPCRTTCATSPRAERLDSGRARLVYPAAEPGSGSGVEVFVGGRLEAARDDVARGSERAAGDTRSRVARTSRRRSRSARGRHASRGRRSSRITRRRACGQRLGERRTMDAVLGHDRRDRRRRE